ncbi:MAG: endonuclease/exonuclease/phosphatase family protein [Lentimicrobium sp.]
MKKSGFLNAMLVTLILTCSLNSKGQQGKETAGEFKIMFYNLENLFDPFDDSLKDDNEFLPTGIRGWTWKKFERKLQNTSKVIITAGGWRPPEIVGFCEVENRFALIQLLKRTPLEPFGYQIVHHESPDARGIDVGLIYRPDRFTLLYNRAIPVIFEGDSVATTRDILYVKGLVPGDDTLHLFVNHWPSKYGGAAATIPRRRDAALALKAVTDSIAAIHPDACLVIMGDFNDQPDDESMAIHLGARSGAMDTTGYYLYNLMQELMGKWDTGSNKFREEWSIIDQFVVSSALLRHTTGLRLSEKRAEIFRAPFLIEDDINFNGTKPYRTFSGPTYQGGFSDHLPILLHLRY